MSTPAEQQPSGSEAYPLDNSANTPLTTPLSTSDSTPSSTPPNSAQVGAQPASMSARMKALLFQIMKFGAVGASGFLVNQAVFVGAKKATEMAWAVHELDPFLNLLGSQFHLRWYHVFSIVAFLVANVWNFCLNRSWTFKGGEDRYVWWKQFPQFLAIGIVGLSITLLISTAVVNPESPFALPSDVFDGSTGLRTKAYWGNFLGVVGALPVNFYLNSKLTFSKEKIEAREGVSSV